MSPISHLILLTSRLWRHFIPEEDRHVFERGVYFSVEVIPDRLAVISLNTLFWYDSNTCKSESAKHAYVS